MYWKRGSPAPKRISVEAARVFEFATEDGQFRFEMEFKDAGDLETWSREKLAPVVLEWYPKIVAQLPSERLCSAATGSIAIPNRYERDTSLCTRNTIT